MSVFVCALQKKSKKSKCSENSQKITKILIRRKTPEARRWPGGGSAPGFTSIDVPSSLHDAGVVPPRAEVFYQ